MSVFFRIKTRRADKYFMLWSFRMGQEMKTERERERDRKSGKSMTPENLAAVLGMHPQKKLLYIRKLWSTKLEFPVLRPVSYLCMNDDGFSVARIFRVLSSLPVYVMNSPLL